jgi:phage replication initiation protein
MTQKTTVDWLRFRTQSGPREVLEAFRPLYGTLGSALKLEPLPRGILGFEQACSMVIGDMPVGRVDFGGSAQRGWVRVDVPGKGCEWVQDWDALDVVERLEVAEVRRLDIALTTWEGQVGHDTVVNAHAAGRFASGGRPPHMQVVTSTDPTAGRTCYVGKRDKADKFFRGYEKGRELASKLPPSLAASCTHIDSFPVEGIYRCEVELKAENRPIPWEVVERRDQYFAGAYPFCADILPDIEADILQRRPDRAPQRDLAAALENCRIQYGATIYTALRAYGGDITAVWDKIVGNQHNEALLEAGVLLVDHE